MNLYVSKPIAMKAEKQGEFNAEVDIDRDTNKQTVNSYTLLLLLKPRG